MDNEGKGFKETRLGLNLTQVELAAKLNVSQGTITDIERGRIGISKKMQKKLKDFLSIETKQLETNWCYCPHCGKALK